MEPITAKGLELKKEEFQSLKEKREYWVEKKEDAYQQGDPTENQEYITAMDELQRIENAMQKLEEIILTSRLIDPKDFDLNSVKFGLTVVLENVDNEDDKKEFTIVSTNEVNIDKGLISNISPIGKTLLGKEIDDELDILDATYYIKEIKY